VSHLPSCQWWQTTDRMDTDILHNYCTQNRQHNGQNGCRRWHTDLGILW